MGRLLRLWRTAGQDLSLLWFALSHPSRPGWLVPASALMLVYGLEPLNIALPLLGAVDDLVLLPLALHAMLRLLPEDIRRGHASRSVQRP